MSIYIFEFKWLITDQSENCLNDCFGESILTTNHSALNTTLLNGGETEGGSRCFLGHLFSKSLYILLPRPSLQLSGRTYTTFNLTSLFSFQEKIPPMGYVSRFLSISL